MLDDNQRQLSHLRSDLRNSSARSENEVLIELASNYGMSVIERESAFKSAVSLVTTIRNDERPGLMEVFLTEYGLSTDEGVALMCLAEALLRVPDAETIDRLIEDKLISSSWREHVGESPSALVNTATYGLIVTSKVLSNPSQESLTKLLRNTIKRVGTPVIRKAVKRAMKEMGHQFVLGETIDSALKKGAKAVTKGYTYSFDMLGEAALTQSDADNYFQSYQNAITTLGNNTTTSNITQNPGISIKLSALHPRYEFLKTERVIKELVPDVLKLAMLAKNFNLGLNIDAEEADRLDLSLDVIEAVLKDEGLAGWDGFGVVVQAYNKSANFVIDWLYALAQQHKRKIMVRLVKGAYWDTEIKRAQVEGLDHYPVFTRKSFTDISYLCCAKKLLAMSHVIYPQFATHNAHTVASVIELANNNEVYEFQRLHGMGDNVYRSLVENNTMRCRIYAPVGEHRDLLAYLVRRLLENGANSSFVNQIVDLDVPVEQVVTDPFDALTDNTGSSIAKARDLYQPERTNSRGCDLHDAISNSTYQQGREPFKQVKWRATPLLATPYSGNSRVTIINPSNSKDIVGEALEANERDVELALELATSWADSTPSFRCQTLNKVADLLEKHTGEVSALLAREAGKAPQDIIAEVREAVDFLRYYSAQAHREALNSPLGVFVCISPWNFPLAIFVGQICAALATGNAVIAKPAESTPLIAFFTVKLFYQAGVPREVLQLLIGEGKTVGAALVSSPKVSGVCFTGSTSTGIQINRSMAEHLDPSAPLIAETGGLNAMVVDSTALPEQAVKDIVKSAFQSAGQRCSALRLLYLQDDVYESFVEMLYGAMDELIVGDSWELSTDVGPLISKAAQKNVQAYLDNAACNGKLLKTLNPDVSLSGHYIPPTVIEVNGINDMEEEVFAPVLHLAKFSANEFTNIVEDINGSGYGLTFGLHSRIDTRVEEFTSSLHVGNMYINRDQIGAVVGSQPFGGENLSGTGPKAGGPNYLHRFCKAREITVPNQQKTNITSVDLNTAQRVVDSIKVSNNAITQTKMPGPTGESNTLYEYGKGIILCLGPDLESALAQATIARNRGCVPVTICPGAQGDYAIDGFLPREFLIALNNIRVVALWGNGADAVKARQALAKREGAIIRLACDTSLDRACVHERHVCIDTTAAGGNASLLATAS